MITTIDLWGPLKAVAGAPESVKFDAFKHAAREVAGIVASGTIEKAHAVDRLYAYAEAAGLDQLYGIDNVQSAFAEAFAHPITSEPSENARLDAQVLAIDQRPRIVADNYRQFLEREFPPRETLLAPWLPAQGLAMIHAPRGVGKTHVAMVTCWAVATGGGFLRWKAPAARRVLLLDGEMPGALLQERLKRVVSASRYVPLEPDYLRIAAADLNREGLPDIADPTSQQFYADLIADANLVVVDNLSTLCRGLKENEADSWSPVQSWCLNLRRAGRSVLLIHHAGKSGTQRGTSRKEDVLDTVIGLKRPPDYQQDQGARFEIHFEKARGFFGSEAEPFEARLIGEQWQESEIRSGDDDATLKALRAQGLSIRDIADRTGVPRSTVARRLGVGGDDV